MCQPCHRHTGTNKWMQSSCLSAKPNLSPCMRPLPFPPFPQVTMCTEVTRQRVMASPGWICVRTRWKSLQFQLPQLVKLLGCWWKASRWPCGSAAKGEGINAFILLLSSVCLSLLWEEYRLRMVTLYQNCPINGFQHFYLYSCFRMTFRNKRVFSSFELCRSILELPHDTDKISTAAYANESEKLI